MRLAKVGFLCILVGVASIVFSSTAAKAEGPNHEHLESLEPYVGKWLHRGRTADGKALRVTRTARWALDGNYLTVVTVIRSGNEVVLTHRHMVGWDSDKKIIRSWIFSSSGNFVRGTWKNMDDGRPVGTMRGLTPEAKVLAATVTYTHIDNDTFIYRAENRTEGGNPLADIKWRFVRVAQ
ncbi:MAG: hypothetical protein K8R46_01060 [Pirellulales bacterium]|nr:hypothetical protein [Pirellulales bacterium]